MFLAAEWYTAVGVIVTAAAGAVGAYGVLVAKRTEWRSATREETQQALSAQSSLLDRYEKRIATLDANVATLHDDLATVRKEYAELLAEQSECHRRLAEAEKRIEDFVNGYG